MNSTDKTATEAVKLLAQRILDVGYDDLPERERKVIERVAKRVSISRDMTVEYDKGRTFGQRLADHIAAFGGSWSFIILFAAAIAIWVVANTVVLPRWNDAFDPYPFILLNLILSCLAALQAPIIMMSQNRQAAKDRSDARNDYEVNVRAEMQITTLHAKVDALREEEIHRLMQLVEAQQQRVEALQQQLAQTERH